VQGRDLRNSQQECYIQTCKLLNILRFAPMPFRNLVTKELSELFAVLSHPMRIRIVEELRTGEKDVGTLTQVLQISQTGVSQHLSVLRTHRLIIERKEGRNVFYHLRDPELAVWILGGLQFAGPFQAEPQEFESAVKKVRNIWLSEKG